MAVVPFGNGGMELSGNVGSEVPYVFGLEGSRWKPLHSAPFPKIEDRSKGFATQLKAQTDSLICAGPKSAIWLASWNAYRVREVSPFEKSRQELMVGSGRIEWTKFTGKEREANDEGLRKRGIDPSTNQGGQVYPQHVIRAVVCGRDGTLYLFVTTGEGLALDRFEPSMQRVERVLLDMVSVSGGPMTAVLANGELVFGGRSIEDGLWHIRLEELETAGWKPIRGARINGRPAPASQSD